MHQKIWRGVLRDILYFSFKILIFFIIARAHPTKKPSTKRVTKKAATGSKRIHKKAGAKKTGVTKRHAKKSVVAHHDAPAAAGSAHTSPAKASAKKHAAKKHVKKAAAGKRKAHAKK